MYDINLYRNNNCYVNNSIIYLLYEKTANIKKIILILHIKTFLPL